MPREHDHEQRLEIPHNLAQFSLKKAVFEPSYGRLSDTIFRGFRVRDKTPSISRHKLISISVEVLRSYSVYLLYLGRAGTARGDDDDLAAAIRAVADDRSGGALLDSVLGNSPYLGQCLLADPAFACFLLADGPQAALVRVLAALDAATPPGAGGADIMAALRRAKRGVALLVGIADMAGAWPLETVTGTLSDFADRAIGISIAHLLHGAAAVGDLHLSDPADPERDSGLVILGMGKLGAHELNYSSDIDLIVLYDGERVTYTGKQSAQQLFVRMVRDLIRMLEERTGDGYVFRTDLRLRPDPGSTPRSPGRSRTTS